MKAAGLFYSSLAWVAAYLALASTVSPWFLAPAVVFAVVAVLAAAGRPRPRHRHTGQRIRSGDGSTNLQAGRDLEL